ncbi:hypothetical protein [Azospirillum sp. TSA2s]|nr:hypothetical protein [Azospirillum sp. TSA2s]
MLAEALLIAVSEFAGRTCHDSDPSSEITILVAPVIDVHQGGYRSTTAY